MLTPTQLEDAYALTLKNPWAHLVARGGKDVENRTWMPPAGVDWLLIHAGMGWDGKAPGLHDRAMMPFGKVVATASLLFACNASLKSDTVICGCGEWAMPRQCHWKLGNVWPLPYPVPAMGRQKLWKPARSVVKQLDEQLAFHRGIDEWEREILAGEGAR